MTTFRTVQHGRIARVARSAARAALGAFVALGLVAGAVIGPQRAHAAGPVTVLLGPASYIPTILTVTAGTTVVFDNSSPLPHTATADNDAFDTGMIAVGQKKSVTLSTPGTFGFYCQFHGAPGGVGQSGTITVTAAVGATPSPAASGAAAATNDPNVPPAPPTASILEALPFRDPGMLEIVGAGAVAVGVAFVLEAIGRRGRASRVR